MLGAFRASVVAHRAGRYTITASALTDGFLLSLRAAGRRPETVTWHSKRLARLIAFLGDGPVRKISADDVRRYLVTVKAGTAGPVSDGYVDGYRKSVAAMFAWAARCAPHAWWRSAR